MMSWINRDELPKGVPIPWAGKRKRRKRHTGDRGMMRGSAYTVPTWRYCCYGHDGVAYDKGQARKREQAAWQNDNALIACDETLWRIMNNR